MTIEDGNTTRPTRVLRLTAFVASHIELPDEIETWGNLSEQVARLFKQFEDRLTTTLFNVRQGTVTFETRDDVVTKLTLTYPEFRETFERKPS